MEMTRFLRLYQDATDACVQEVLSPGTEAGLAACTSLMFCRGHMPAVHLLGLAQS